TASGSVFLGVSIQATAGSSLQPEVPRIAGLTPLLTRTGTNSSFALFSVTSEGLKQLQVLGRNGTTSGGYTLRVFVAGDVNNDGVVAGYDSQLLEGALGTTAGTPGYVLTADANLDNVIDGADLRLLAVDLGFQANRPPVTTVGQATTHQDLAV